MNESMTRRILLAATIVSFISTAGSLYFSTVLGLYPCRLCWFQRILMYPLVVILGVAVWESRFGVYRTVIPLAGLGWLIAAYHSFLQIVGTGGICRSVCASVQFRLFGLLTIPNLSLIGFTLILGLLFGGVIVCHRDD